MLTREQHREAVLIYGLKVWCEECGVRGRWAHPRLRLREVRCARELALGVCGGRLRAAPRNPQTRRAPQHWPRLWIEWRPATALGSRLLHV